MSATVTTDTEEHDYERPVCDGPMPHILDVAKAIYSVRAPGEPPKRKFDKLPEWARQLYLDQAMAAHLARPPDNSAAAAEVAEEAVAIVVETERAELERNKCGECDGGQGEPEECAECCPVFDDIRLRRRALLARLDTKTVGK